MLIKTENGRVFESSNLVAIQVGRNKEAGTFNGIAILSCGISEITMPVTKDGTEEYALQRIDNLFVTLGQVTPTWEVKAEEPEEWLEQELTNGIPVVIETFRKRSEPHYSGGIQSAEEEVIRKELVKGNTSGLVSVTAYPKQWRLKNPEVLKNILYFVRNVRREDSDSTKDKVFKDIEELRVYLNSKAIDLELPVSLAIIDLTEDFPEIRHDGFYSSCRIE